MKKFCFQYLRPHRLKLVKRITVVFKISRKFIPDKNNFYVVSINNIFYPSNKPFSSDIKRGNTLRVGKRKNIVH